MLLKRRFSVLLLMSGLLCGIVYCSRETTDPSVTAMGFTGKQYLEIENSASLKSAFAGDFTIEMWVSGDDSRAEVARTLIMVGNNDGGNEIAIYQGPEDSSMVVVFIDERPFGQFYVTGLDWSAGEKHYLCLSRAANFFSFYVDGRRLRSIALDDIDLDIGTSNLLIGGDYDGFNSNSGNYWMGTIDEVRLWSKAIHSEEVSFHHRNPDKLTEHYSADGLTPLKGFWRFNREYSGYVPDESGNGNHAVIRGDSQSLYWVTAP
ncbi:MAG: LamG domain-containing protein [Fidelibacterota bacterium]